MTTLTAETEADLTRWADRFKAGRGLRGDVVSREDVVPAGLMISQTTTQDVAGGLGGFFSRWETDGVIAADATGVDHGDRPWRPSRYGNEGNYLMGDIEVVAGHVFDAVGTVAGAGRGLLAGSTRRRCLLAAAQLLELSLRRQKLYASAGEAVLREMRNLADDINGWDDIAPSAVPAARTAPTVPTASYDPYTAYLSSLYTPVAGLFAARTRPEMVEALIRCEHVWQDDGTLPEGHPDRTPRLAELLRAAFGNPYRRRALPEHLLSPAVKKAAQAFRDEPGYAKAREILLAILAAGRGLPPDEVLMPLSGKQQRHVVGCRCDGRVVPCACVGANRYPGGAELVPFHGLYAVDVLAGREGV